MKRTLLLSLVAGLLCTTVTAQNYYPINPVPFTSVKIGDGFWGDRLASCRDVTVPLAFEKCDENGRYENFVRAAHPSAEYDVDKLEPFPFDDTDVYKTIEGASYLMQTYPDAKMKAYIDSVLTIVAAGQEVDGYLYTARTSNPTHPHSWSGANRWDRVEDGSHEFYNLGHMLEGAVAHYQATGERTFLDIAIKYADCVCREIGIGEGQRPLIPGHQIAEMGLVKLYTATGDKKYLDQAKFFLDMRGKTSHRDSYNQSHLPVVEQSEAVGHAVRATYMYAGMADVAAITGDTTYINAIDRIWDNIVGKKYYLTGGIGATSNGEAFGRNYELPNLTAYCETCAAIGLVYTAYRLFLLHGTSDYYDVLERTLYNGVISGLAIDGGSFFYPNPLASTGSYSRKSWFGCACCPSNLCRFIPSIPGYIYAVKDNNIYMNLFTDNSSTIIINGKEISLSQRTGYPYEGDITVSIDKTAAKQFGLKIRIPGWVRNQVVPSNLYSFDDNVQPTYSVSVNGQQISDAVGDDGYLLIDRKWKRGDTVKIEFDMTPRVVKANERVADDRNRVAFERGPIVYCAEWTDNSLDLSKVIVGRTISLDGTITVSGQTLPAMSCPAQSLSTAADGSLKIEKGTLRLIPYYAWAHRGEGDMEVWLPYTTDAWKTIF